MFDPGFLALGFFIACCGVAASAISLRFGRSASEFIGVWMLAFLAALHCIPVALLVLTIGNRASYLLAAFAVAVGSAALLVRWRRCIPRWAPSILPFGAFELAIGAYALYRVGQRIKFFNNHWVNVHPLWSGDTTNFEWPAAFNFHAAGSLWIDVGSFMQSRPAANYLVSTLPAFLTHSDALAGMSTALMVVAMAVFIVLIGLETGSPALGAPLAVAVSLLGLFVFFNDHVAYWNIFMAVGKADNATTAFTLAAIYFGLRSVDGSRRDVVFQGLALGVLAAVKSTAIPLALCFALFRLVIDLRGRPVRSWLARATLVPAAVNQAALAVPVLLIGGWWYLRNLLMFGTLIEGNDASRLWRLSVWHNIDNPAYFAHDYTGKVFLASVLAVPVAVYWILAPWARGAGRGKRAFFAASYVATVAVYVLTPAGVVGVAYSDGSHPFELRLSTAMIPMLLLGIALHGGYLLRLVGRAIGDAPLLTLAPEQLRSTTFALALAATVAAAFYVEGTWDSRRPLVGLPGFEQQAPNGPRTNVYAWVQDNLHGQRILAAESIQGYGLLGRRFDNDVYLLHLDDHALPEILRRMSDVRADYVFVERPPSGFIVNTGLSGYGEFPPWVKAAQESGLLVQIYRDDLVLGFRRSQGCAVSFAEGWSVSEVENPGSWWRWGMEQRVVLNVASASEGVLTLRARIGAAVVPNAVTVNSGGKTLTRLALDSGTYDYVEFQVPVVAGVTKVALVSREPARLFPPDTRPLSIRLGNLEAHMGDKPCEVAK